MPRWSPGLLFGGPFKDDQEAARFVQAISLHPSAGTRCKLAQWVGFGQQPAEVVMDERREVAVGIQSEVRTRRADPT